jgi:predicted Zn-dependent peptidase
VPSEYIDLALDVEADAIMNSTFKPKEIERERLVILEEIRRNDDNNQSVINLWHARKYSPIRFKKRPLGFCDQY